MAKGNFEGFYPFIFIILFYLVSNLRKSMKKKESVEQPRPSPQLKPAVKSRPPPIEPIKVPIAKKGEASLLPPSRHKSMTKRPRIQKIVGRLNSKKDLIYISEILARHDKF